MIKSTGYNEHLSPFWLVILGKINKKKKAEIPPLEEIQRLMVEIYFSDAEPRAQQARPNIEPPLHIM